MGPRTDLLQVCANETNVKGNLEVLSGAAFEMVEPNHYTVQNRALLHKSMIKSTGYVTDLHLEPYGAVGIYGIHVSSSSKTLEYRFPTRKLPGILSTKWHAKLNFDSFTSFYNQ